MKIIKVISVTILIIPALFLRENIAFADIKWAMDGSATTGYDSNITYVNNKPIADMITRLSFNGGLAQQVKNEQFNIKTGLTENVYTDHSSQDNLSESLNADYTGDVNPYDHIKGVEAFTHYVDPPSLQDAFGRINGSYDTYYNKFDLEYAHDFTEQWTSTLKYMQTNYLYSLKGLSDSAAYNPEASLKYAFSSMAQATVNYDYRESVFSPGASSQANTPSLAWRQYLTTQWYVDLLSGVDFIKGFGESTIRPRYAAALTHEVDKNTQLTLKYDKQFETDGFTQDIFNDWHIFLNANHQFTNRISANIAIFTGQGRYIKTGIKEKFIGTNVEVRYALNDHMDVSASYGLQDNISNSSVRSDVHNTFFLGFTFKF